MVNVYIYFVDYKREQLCMISFYICLVSLIQFHSSRKRPKIEVKRACSFNHITLNFCVTISTVKTKQPWLYLCVCPSWCYMYLLILQILHLATRKLVTGVELGHWDINNSELYILFVSFIFPFIFGSLCKPIVFNALWIWNVQLTWQNEMPRCVYNIKYIIYNI